MPTAKIQTTTSIPQHLRQLHEGIIEQAAAKMAKIIDGLQLTGGDLDPLFIWKN